MASHRLSLLKPMCVAGSMGSDTFLMITHAACSCSMYERDTPEPTSTTRSRSSSENNRSVYSITNTPGICRTARIGGFTVQFSGHHLEPSFGALPAASPSSQRVGRLRGRFGDVVVVMRRWRPQAISMSQHL